MLGKKFSRMIIACALLLAGLSLCELSTAVAQEPFGSPLSASTYGDAPKPELPYVPDQLAPLAPGL